MSGEPPLADLLPTPMAAGACPAEEAAAITSRSGTSFAAGMAILPKARREGMRAVYAFCRVVDDIADGDFPIDKKHSALDAWRAEVDALYAGGGESVVAQALRPCITAYDLPKEELLLMIEGMAMDVDGPIVAPTEAELDAYIRRVAGTVGLMSMRVFGAWIGQPSHDFALALARALQTTNILRDVEEDADLGRLYLPRERLCAHAMP
ncbi:MAG: squalene/phytoene synthase family protein, partial [Pseudomonadota bacterium]